MLRLDAEQFASAIRSGVPRWQQRSARPEPDRIPGFATSAPATSPGTCRCGPALPAALTARIRSSGSRRTAVRSPRGQPSRPVTSEPSAEGHR